MGSFEQSDEIVLLACIFRPAVADMYNSTILIDATFCSSCENVLYEYKKSYDVLQNRTIMQENYCTDAEEQLSCDNCSVYDMVEADIISIIIEDELLEKVADIISVDIEGCENGGERRA
ncbi:hypothetical protein ACT91Q_15565 [Brevibacillus thermoruber]|uniref:hypothetical protein n=1 Tax=Brevibacillus thermoruber TaxID=33942 RepID=UPI00404153C2